MVHTLQSGVVECLTVMTATDGHAQAEEDRRWQKIQGDEIVCPSMLTCVACVSVIASSVKRRHQKICFWKDLQLPAAGRRQEINLSWNGGSPEGGTLTSKIFLGFKMHPSRFLF